MSLEAKNCQNSLALKMENSYKGKEMGRGGGGGVGPKLEEVFIALSLLISVLCPILEG